MFQLNEDSLDLARSGAWIEHRRLEEISPLGFLCCITHSF